MTSGKNIACVQTCQTLQKFIEKTNEMEITTKRVVEYDSTPGAKSFGMQYYFLVWDHFDINTALVKKQKIIEKQTAIDGHI
jgi:hypothetical protein